MKLILKCLVLLGLMVHSVGYAWNAVGHMVIANIAYERLTPAARVKVDKMVADLGKEYTYIHMFYQIAPWPDALRSQKIETFTHWHYIDLAFSDDGTPLKDLTDSDNVIWAINKIQPIVGNDKANYYERARFLAFLVHTVGDIHQPLHTVGRITAKNPNGDKGGNLFHVKYPVNKPQTITLHKLWDDGMSLFAVESNFSNVLALTKEITEIYPESYFANQANDLSAGNWGQEGLALSKSFVYTTAEDQVPTSSYLGMGREHVKERVALAGYRLANMLNKLLK